MSISTELNLRCQNLCELCSTEVPAREFAVSPKKNDVVAHVVAVCETCMRAMEKKDSFHWRCLEGSIWNPEPSVQALSYRILQNYKGEDWAENLLSSVEPEENIVEWALSSLTAEEVHKDAFGNKLENGDTVVLTQALNVKGTNFTASKGTVVKRIKLVHDNHEQIEGKINDQTIVILTKFVKKGA
ncbi:MAG: PhnA domain-containing protein [Bacteroidota bacterium]